MIPTLKLSDLLDGSATTTASSKTTELGNKTQEEIIEDIRECAAELYRRGLLMPPEKLHEHQLAVIRSMEDWHSGKIKPITGLINIDSIPFGKHTHVCIGEHIPAAAGRKEDEFAKAVKHLWGTMKETIHNYVSPMIQEINTQTRIEECEKILRKHPGRQDLRMELMKLQKTLPKKIGKPKRKKK